MSKIFNKKSLPTQIKDAWNISLKENPPSIIQSSITEKKLLSDKHFFPHLVYTCQFGGSSALLSVFIRTLVS